jgi:hypothetical protein
MTEFKGTPGPWKIIHGGFVADDGFCVGSDNAAASRIKNVAECWPCTIIDQQHREELLANARLIAAAPSLLDACYQALEWVESDEATHGRQYGTGNAMRAAIAKALGESQ